MGYEEKLREQNLFSLAKKKWKWDWIVIYDYMSWSYEDYKARDLFTVANTKQTRVRDIFCDLGGSDKTQGNIIHQDIVQHWKKL